MLRPYRFACTAVSVGDEEFVAAPDDLELVLEDLEQWLWLESSDCVFQGLNDDATLFFKK